TPSFWCSEHDHRPARSYGSARGPGLILYLPDISDTLIKRDGHRLVHTLRVGALHEVWSPAVATEQVFHFFVADAGKQSGVIDFVPIQVKDRQHSSVPNWIQELANVP